jgi:aspartyl-tRNA(Asn)/glutamyl-tRNA(Gln) amidotransferase subunit A
MQGAMPLAPSLDCPGFLARTAEDCAHLLAAAVPELDLARLRATLTTRLGENSGPITVAIPEIEAEQPATDEIRVAIAECARILAECGAATTTTAMPDLGLAGTLGNVLLGAEAGAMHRPWLRDRPEHYGTQVRRRIERGLFYPATSYVDALRLRSSVLRSFLENAFGSADALLLPVMSEPAPTIAEATQGDEDHLERRFSMFSFWTRGINYLGLPALALPVGFSETGMPIGIQLVGRPHAEATLLRLGHQYQRCTDWHLKVPPIADAGTRRTQTIAKIL